MSGKAYAKAMRAFLAILAVAAGAVVFEPSTPAYADPICQDNGAYALFARGSGAPFDSDQARAFRNKITLALQGQGFSKIEWAELGNLDNRDFNPDTEYPAVRIDDWGPLRFTDNALVQAYNTSVEIGMKELYRHLNDRYAGNGPRDTGSCNNETLVLAGYSQGADVVGWALQRPELSQAVKDHIGYIALYGDPKFNPGSLQYRMNRVSFQSDWWWVRGDDTGFRYINSWPLPDYAVRNSGILGARTPYVSGEFKGRFGSWCAYEDGICSGIWPKGMDVHTINYTNYWIAQSAPEIAYIAKQKHDQLSSGGGGTIANYLSLPPTSGEPVHYPTDPTPELPRVTQLKRTADPDGTPQVYAATSSTVTEAWWHPGGDGVHTDEVFHVGDKTVTGFDKTNLPEGKQAVYTSVDDGVYETWWDAQHSPGTAKIITGLTGVRKVIADNRSESGQYVHRLYILASDGPYEAWWKDGDPTGIHLSRLVNISNPVTMVKSTGPDGTDQLYVASDGWTYEIWWRPSDGVHYSTITNVSGGGINSLSKVLNGTEQRLFTGTSTAVWQSIWNNSTPVTNPEVSGKSGIIASQAIKTGSAFQIYTCTTGGVREYWYTSSSSGNSNVVSRSQNDITTCQKVNDGNYQDVYVGTSGGEVYETWWGGGQGPTTSKLFAVAR